MKMQNKLLNHYKLLFEKFQINKDTGLLEKNIPLKFPTYPYIGSKYGNSKKILVVGLDLGSDKEKPSGIQSFEERRQAIEEKIISKHNPHIAGTYFTALFFLQDNLNWHDSWNKLKNISTCQKALKYQDKLPPTNPLSYIALTNYYKFVTKNRKNRRGGLNRKHLDEEFELNFFIEEVKIFDPDIIIFQSTSFNHKDNLLFKLLELKRDVCIGPHPAYWGKKEPEYFILRYDPKFSLSIFKLKK